MLFSTKTLIAFLPFLFFPSSAAALKISGNLAVIEYTPELVAAEDYYSKGEITFSNGGVAEIVRDSSIHLAANAETQALRQYANHRNLRIIYNVVESAYRLVVSKKSGVKTLADLKGKRIGSYSGTSAGYFVETLLGTVGLKPNDYTIVSGGICLASPCTSSSFPGMLARGSIDAVGMWEPTSELAIEALGGHDNVVIFQNKTVYREIFNLHSTTEKLKDANTRKEIVRFLQALMKAQVTFDTDPEKVLPRASKAVNVTTDVLRKVWPDHNWKGGLPADQLDVLVAEDKYVARIDNRAALSRSQLANLVDGSVMEEALQTL